MESPCPKRRPPSVVRTARTHRKHTPHSHRTHRTCTRTPPLHARTCSLHTPHTHAPHMSKPHVHVHAPHVHAPHMHAPHVRLHAPHMHTPHVHAPHIRTYLPPVTFARKMGEEKGARISPGATNLSRGHEPPPRPRIFPRAEKGGGVHAGGLKFLKWYTHLACSVSGFLPMEKFLPAPLPMRSRPDPSIISRRREAMTFILSASISILAS